MVAFMGGWFSSLNALFRPQTDHPVEIFSAGASRRRNDSHPRMIKARPRAQNVAVSDSE
jgi:hypothetical protein